MKNKTNSMVKITLSLNKNDQYDFDRQYIGELLGVTPTDSKAPEISKGKIYCGNSENISSDYNITVIKCENPPYRFIKHAFWSYETDYNHDFETCMEKIKNIVGDKAKTLNEICIKNNLSAQLEVKIYKRTKSNSYYSLKKEDVDFVASIGATIGFNLCF